MRRFVVESNAMKRHSLQIFYGWVVLACVGVVLLVTYEVQYSFGVFFTTMLQDLGWSRASLAGAFSLYSLVYIGLSFYSGRLTDRIGPRWVIALGGLCLERIAIEFTARRPTQLGARHCSVIWG